MDDQTCDVAIVGGGAAGLSAALVLGRARRRVVVIDAGTPRNAPAAHMQGFLSRDGMPPSELLAVGRREVTGYGVEIVDGPFERVLAGARQGDFVYLDPPYAPLSVTSAFRSYTAQRFSTDDQARLQAAVVALAARGVSVLLSNSTAPEIRRLYERNAAARAAGLRARRIPARRAINSRADRRGVVEELLVTNLPRLRSAPARGGPGTAGPPGREP